MSNSIPYSCVPLRVLGGDIFDGLTALGTSLGITQITAGQFQTVLTAFINADNAFNTARTARQTISDTFHAAEAALTEWLGKARAVLTTHLGKRWTNEWVEAGFVNHSTAIPRRIEERIALTATLVTYFTNHPSLAAPTTGVTAAAGSDLHYAMTVARLGVHSAKTDLELKAALRTTKCMELRAKIRLVITTLASILGRNDGRWTIFGLNIPGANTTPGQPQNLVATALPGHTILAQCEATALATRYRWRVKVLGVDEKYRLGASTTEPVVEITAVAPGQRVSLIVQAVNGTSQGVASEPVEVTVLAAASPAPVSASAPVVTEPATREEHAPHAGNGNGHGNGVSRTLVAPEHGTLVFTGR